MNFINLVQLISLFANIILGSYIFYLNPRDKKNILYSLFTFSLAFWALSDFLISISPTNEIAQFYNVIGSVVTSLLPAFLFHFFLIFTKKEYIIKKLYYLPYLPAVLFLIISLMYSNLIAESFEITEWGYSHVSGALYNVFSFYVVIYVVMGLILCYRFLKTTKSKKEKLQSKVLIGALSIPTIGGVIGQVIPALIGIDTFPVTTILTTFTTVIIGYVILRYGMMNPIMFSITRKIFASFFIIILAITSVTLFNVGFYSNIVVHEQVYNRLETNTQSRAAHINTFMEEHKQTVEAFSRKLAVIDMLARDENDPEYEKNLARMEKILKNEVEIHDDILKISLLDTGGIVIASSDDSSIDADNSNVISALLTDGFFYKDVHWSKGFGMPCIDYALPVFDDGKIIGGVIVDMGMEKLDMITSDITGFGESGETYLINSDMYMITSSRFISNTFLTQKVDNLNSINCFTMNKNKHVGHEPTAIIYDNYRGVRVIGTHAYLPEMGWCLISEFDEAEANASVVQMQNVLTLVFIIFMLIGIIFSYILSRSLTRPIIKLRDAILRIGEGERDIKIDIRSNDEIGELGGAFIQMIHNLKESEKEIKKHTQNLEKEVLKRTKELSSKVDVLSDTKTAVLNMMEDMDEANKRLVETQEKLKESLRELKEMNTKKDQFISIAAHELKTPLTSIHGFSQLLQNRKIANNFTKRNKYLKIMDHETKRLSKLVEDILDLSRIDLGTVKIDLSEIDVNELVKSAKREMEMEIKEKGLTSEYDIEPGLPKIVTDGEKLTEIMINLINNATKYTSKGKISVKVFRDNDNIHFVVKDTGVGVSKMNQEKIFERFYQVDSSLARKGGGTGLGLALCKEFVEMLGGKIWMSSRMGKGSEFHFTLPLKGVPKEHIRGEERKAIENLKKSGKVREDVEKMGFGETGS